MDYPEAIEWLYARQGAGIKLGLANIRRLLDALGVAEARREDLACRGDERQGVDLCVGGVGAARGRVSYRLVHVAPSGVVL